MVRRRFGSYSVGKKLGIMEAVIVLVLMVVFTLFVVTFTRNILDRNLEQDLQRQVASARNLVELYCNDVKGSTEKLSNVFSAYFPARFSRDREKTVRIGSVETPLLRHGSAVMNLNFEAVDRFSSMTGGVATIFARSGDDFVRIATSLKKEDGNRAIGTFLGKQHPAYRLLMEGESYLGRATLFGKEYSTKYLPIKGESGDVIGILFVGYDITDGIAYLKEKIKAIKIGKSGYVFALNSAPGPQYGTLLIHPAEEGKNILAAKDSRGGEFIKTMLEKKDGLIHYSWTNKDLGEKIAREKMVAFASFPEWHMVLGAGGYEDELFADIAVLRNLIMAAVVIMAAIMIVLLNLAAQRMVTVPLHGAVQFAQQVAAGDLTGRLGVKANDEVGALAEALNSMVRNLKEMIGKIRDTSGQVASAATEISAGSAQLTRAAHGQASAAEETSSTMVQMAASIQTVAANTDSLASNADEVSASIQELGASSEQVSKSSETMASSVSETSATIEQMTVSIERVAKSTEELASSVTETSSTVEQMTVSIDQVAENSQELQQVVTETAAVVEEMAVSIRQVAKNVADADSVAKLAAKEGYAGQQAVQEALAAMQRVGDVIGKTADSIVNLGKRSEEIGSIVSVINEIADQTNLLALNAAIEAARAGDAGRGFAVVAEEVRKLAERSVAATKEIGQVIKQVQNDTTASVKYGELASQEAESSMALSATAGNVLVNIIKSIEQTSRLMSEIAGMTGEQAKSSDQVIRAVEKMSRTTAQVATAAREQALGGRQIRIAVERMNSVTQEVTGATREQAAGSRQIRIAVENMNRVTQQVNIATREQALSAKQIVEAVTGMNVMTQSVANATGEQRKGGEMVVKAVENISDLTRENLSSVEQLSRSAENLSRQADDLAGMVAQFRVD